MSILFNVVGLLCFCVCGCLADCSVHSIQSCQSSSGLAGYLKSQGIDITSEHAYDSNWLFTLNRTQLTKYCSLFDAYDSCINNNVVDLCEIAVKLVLAGVEHGVHFLCGKSFNEYLNEHRECLKQESVGDGIMDCSKDAVLQMQSDTSHDEVCSDAKKGESCEIDSVNRLCGKNTGQWFGQFVHKVDNPVFKHYGCNAWPTWVIILSIAAGVMAVSLLLVGVRMYTVKKRNAAAATGINYGRM